MRSLTLRQLRAVLAIDRLGKVHRVAREIGLTPSAVTLQLQQAEAEAGAALFDRTREGLRATDAGRAMIAAAQAIELRLATLTDELAAIRGLRRGTLRLGAVSTAKYFAPPLMAGFLDEHPGIDLKLAIGNRAAMIAALEQQEVDLVLMGRPPREMPVNTALIGDHPLVVIAAPGHALADARGITRSRLAEEPLLMRETGSGTRNALDLFLGGEAGPPAARRAEFSSNETIKQAVMAGLGVALISAHTIALEARLGLVVLLDVVNTPIRRQWFLVGRADRAPSPPMAAFRDFIARGGRGFLPVVTRPG